MGVIFSICHILVQTTQFIFDNVLGFQNGFLLFLQCTLLKMSINILIIWIYENRYFINHRFIYLIAIDSIQLGQTLYSRIFKLRFLNLHLSCKFADAILLLLDLAVYNSQQFL